MDKDGEDGKMCHANDSPVSFLGENSLRYMNELTSVAVRHVHYAFANKSK